MELGHYGWSQKLILKRNDTDINFRTTVATPNYGTLSIGDGAWDGLSTGKFVGSSNGTVIAVNAISGFSGNLLDLQTAGISEFKVDSSGNVTMNGTSFTTSAGAILAYSNFNFRNHTSLASGDTTMTSAGTFYDGPTVSLEAGKWLILANCVVLATASAGKVTGKIWDGTTTISSGEKTQTASTDCALSLCGITASLTNTTVYKMSVTCTVTLNTLKAATAHSSPGNFASWIMAWQIG